MNNFRVALATAARQLSSMKLKRGCVGKVAYRSRERAQARAEKQLRVSGLRLHIYRCSTCECWHLTKLSQDVTP